MMVRGGWMGELWRGVSEILWRRPSLWLPVLVADLLGFFLNRARLALVRATVLQHTEYHSALGGAPVRTPVTASALHSAGNAALVIDWTSYLLRLLLYASAFIVTAVLVRGYRRRVEKPWSQVFGGIQRYAGGILSLSLRAWAIDGAGALLFGVLFSELVSHGHKAVLAGGWAESGATLLLLVTLALLLAPVAIQVLAKRFAPASLKQQAQTFAVSMCLIALALGTFISANMRTVHGGPSIGRTLLELTGSWIAALPYAVLFTGLALLALEIPSDALDTEP
jgi:hypothetical protein